MTHPHHSPFLTRPCARWLKVGSALTGALLLAACARVNDTGLRLVSTPRDAILIINGQALRGQVLLVPDRTGRVSFALPEGQAPGTAPISACFGNMRHTATNAGALDLRCSDGTNVALQFNLISETRGYAYGSTEAGTVSMTFGLPDEEAPAYLRPPAGKKLKINADDDTITLE